MLTILASVAAYETEVRRERQAAGIAAARAAGKCWGGSKRSRRIKVTEEQARTARRLHREGKGCTEIARSIGVSRQWVYRLITCTPANAVVCLPNNAGRCTRSQAWKNARVVCSSGFVRIVDRAWQCRSWTISRARPGWPAALPKPVSRDTRSGERPSVASSVAPAPRTAPQDAGW